MSVWFRAVQKSVGAALRAFAGLEVTGLEHVPRTGGVVVAANHVSYWDPPVMGVSLPRESHFLAKEELFRNPVFGALIGSLNSIPVRRGVADLRGISRALEALERGGCLILFPEGGRSKEGRLQRARPGVGLIVAHARVPVVPAYLSGTNRFRRWIARQERIRLRIGAPLSVEELLGEDEAEGGRVLYQGIADRVMEAIARLEREMAGAAQLAAPGPTERGAIS